MNGLGVSGAEVLLDGTNITITVPGEEGDQARSLGQTAQLRFREVVGGPVAAAPTAPVDPAAPAPGGASTGDTPSTVSPTGAPSDATPDSTRIDPDSTLPPQGAAGSVVSTPVAPVGFVQALPSRPALRATGHTRPGRRYRGGPGGPGRPDRRRGDRRGPRDPAEHGRDRAGPGPAGARLRGARTRCAATTTRRSRWSACNQDGTEKYVLGPSFLEGTQIDTAQAAAEQPGRGLGHRPDLQERGRGDLGRLHVEERRQERGVRARRRGRLRARPSRARSSDTTQITGQFSQAEAQDLAGVLRYGSLPLSFESSEAQTVSATLGLASLQAGLIAGGIGLALVFVYCLFYYRVLGVLTILSLVLSGVVVYAFLVLLGRWIGFTLDLAGVAGFIVAIGITADSFVIFFERLKDEVREGRSFRSAVPRAWVRARRTILSADAVSFLAAAVLYALAVGQVKGFAFTLGMSTVLDLLVVFLVTHPLVALASNNRVFSSPAWSGLGSVARIGAARRAAAVKGG